MPQNLAEPRLATPGSGLYAEILGAQGSWRSPSAVGSGLNLARRAAAQANGVSSMRGSRTARASSGCLSACAGNSRTGSRRDFVIRAARKPRALARGTAARPRRARRRLPAAFIAFARRASRSRCGIALEPLRQPRARDRGRRSRPARVAGYGWPRELAGVTGNLNALLAGERKRLERYRDDARQSRAQPEDAARGHARPARTRRDGTRRR